MPGKNFYLTLGFVLLLVAGQACSSKVETTPTDQFGFEIGADYQLITYTQMIDYWNKLDQESDRMILTEIGKTAEDRTMVTAIITSPANHGNLARYRDIARRLALAEDLTDEEARSLAAEGKAVVWIDGGLHATEVVGAQQLTELVYQMVSRDDPETLRILDNVILLATLVNPDGMELVGNWYAREPEPASRTSYSDIPRLYHKYVGHDNNRDFYMVNMPETEAINRMLYREWFPQIMYNHHQTGPAGSIIFAPPFRDPFNYNLDPLVILGIEKVGSAMHGRFIAENKPGSVMRSGANYQTWWNGGARTTPYFHNMIGILTEIKGSPTPIDIPFLPELHLPNSDYPYPVPPQEWHFRRSIEYSMTANRAILDLASRYREDFLFNIYRMGKNSIERGSKDNWTINPRRVEAVQSAIREDNAQMVGSGRSRGYPRAYYEMFFKPEQRDARGYILSANQPDFLTAVKFVNTLIKNGIAVHRATQSFDVGGQSFPEGSFVIKTAQAFRPHIIDMFEPQLYPDDIPYPGGPPKAPYDSAGYTLAYQMGVRFARILDGFDGPFEKLEDLAAVPAGEVANPEAGGFLLSHRVNDAFIAINRLLAGGDEVYWLKDTVETIGSSYGAGTIYIPARDTTASALSQISEETGLKFEGTDVNPSGEALKLKPVRIGLWDQYGGSMPSGWLRWMFEQYEFPFELVFPKTLDAGDLNEKFDVLVFVTGAIPGPREQQADEYRRTGQPEATSIPEEWRDRLGTVTQEETIPQLVRFLEEGGTILTIGTSTNLAYHTRLPVSNALVDRATGRPLSNENYYVPGSVLQARIDNKNPLAYGLPDVLDVYFNRSPVFNLRSSSAVRRVAWFDSPAPLRSGWAWGQDHLENGVAVIDADVGNGKLFMFGPLVTFRAQSHGTFKFVFNGIYYGGAETVTF